MAVPKSLMRKKSKEKEQTLAELNSAHRHLQAKCQLGQTSYIELNGLNCSSLRHIISILLTELSRSVWANLDLGRCVQTSPAFGLYSRPRSRFSHTDLQLG